jgi:hypothetical protein
MSQNRTDLRGDPFRDQAAEVWGARLLVKMEFFKSLGRTTRPSEDGIEFFGKLLISSPTTTHYLTGRDTESAADHL